MRPLSVYLVDDHPVVREGLSRFVESQQGLEIAGTAASAARALCELRASPVDVVVVDYRLDDMSGAQLCGRLTAPPYSLSCMALTADLNPVVTAEFIAAGAAGILSKQAQPEHIIDAIRAVGGGSSYMDGVATAMILRRGEPVEANAVLTERELRVLNLVAEGLSNREIAAELCVSTGSAKSYLSTMLRKLGASHRAEAVAVAAREGLLDRAAGLPSSALSRELAW